MNGRHHITALVGTAAAALVLAGCGGGSEPSSTTASAKPKSKPAAGGGSGVTISDFKFSPATINVQRGTKVSVRNNDSTAHTATADDGKTFDTGNIDPGSSATISLSKTGTFKYHCEIHPFMHATIVVG